MKRRTLLLAALLLSCVCQAQKVKIDGIYYELRTTSSTAYVTYEGRDDKGLYINSYTGDIVIPSTIEEKGVLYKVTDIGKGAFANTKTLKTVKLPGDLKSIEPEAFGNCEGLTSISIPMSVTSIGDLAFYKCVNLASVHFDDVASYLYIGKGAFYGCSALNEIRLPKTYGLHVIQPMTFAECRQLTTFTTPNRVDVDEKAFQNCTSLQYAGISKMGTIASNAFEGCTALDEEDKTELQRRNEAFEEKRRAIEAENNLTFIQDERVREIVKAYKDEKELKKKELKKKEPKAKKTRPFTVDKKTEIDHIVYGIDLQRKEARVIDGSQAAGNVEIPTFVTYEDNNYCVEEVVKGAFKKNKNLTGITLPDSLGGIPEMAFMGCENLKTVKMKATTDFISLGKSAFEGCHSLSQVALADSLDLFFLYSRAFYGCSSLTSIRIPYIREKWTPMGQFSLSIDTLAFAKCSSLSEIDLHDCIHAVKEKAFQDCINLKKVSIGLGTYKIAKNAFKGCKALTKEDLTAIDQRVEDNQALNGPPTFPGDVDAWLSRNIHYPKECQEKLIMDDVYIAFIVEEDGSLTDIRIVQALDYQLAAEAVRLVLSMPKWKPAMRAGKIHRMYRILHIPFYIL